MKCFSKIVFIIVTVALLTGFFAFSASAIYHPGHDDNIYLVHNGEVKYELPVEEADTWYELMLELGEQEYGLFFDTNKVTIGTTGSEYQIINYMGQPVTEKSKISGGETYYLSLLSDVSVSFTGDDGRPEVGFYLNGFFNGFNLIQYASIGMEFSLERIGTATFVTHGNKIALSIKSDLYTGQNGLYYFQRSYGDYALVNNPSDVLEEGPAYYLVRVCGGKHSTTTWQAVVEPTCLDKGIEHRVCDECLKPLDSRSVDPLGHDRGFLGLAACSRCGAGLLDQGFGSNLSDTITNWWTDFTGGVPDFFNPGNGLSGDDLSALLSDITLKLDTFGKSLFTIVLGIVILIFLPNIIAFFKWLFGAICDGVESIVDLFKDLFGSKKKKKKKVKANG